MDESPASFLRSLAAVVFISILAVVLARPIFDSGEPTGDRERPSPRKQEEPAAPTPSAETTPSPKPTEEQEQIRLADPLPRECLDPAAPPGAGAVATASRGRISLATPDIPAGGFPGRAPLMWSPSGRYIAFGRASLYDAQTGDLSLLRSSPLRAWTWSPIADCIFGLTEAGLVVEQAGSDDPVTIVAGPISQFRVTEDGRFLSASGADPTELLVDLARHAPVPRRRSGPIFEGLAPSGCNDVPEDYMSASCNESRRFAVAIQNPDHDEGGLGRLWLMDAEGDPIRPIASGDYEDTAPEWGPSGTGVLFLRRPTGSRRLEVWYLPEGGNPGRTPLTVFGLGSLLTHESFRPEAFVDWNLTPPRGEPLIAP